ncbi:hypothetical protein GPALN_012021 [Globodera pallida]|nr:hypothetical protein GPALN_012021 [Globodera pallida]
MNCWCLLLLQIGTIAPDAFARSVSGITGTDKAARSANGAIALESFVRSGNGTNASGNGTNASGNGTNASGNGTIASERFERSANDTNASGNGTNASGNGTIASERFERSANGTNASGNGTNASGNGTIASERFERSANDTNASGNGTNASGNGTNASGNGTNASGNGTNASGNGTIASERFERSANDTNASGNGTNASGNGTIASERFERSANGTNASGNGTNASGNGTNASGNGTIASERFERSANDTNASGNGTNASGNGTNASGNGTNASGNGTNASGNGTNASGNGTIASERFERSANDTNASGNGTNASGNGTIASERFERSANGTNASGNGTNASGNGTIASERFERSANDTNASGNGTNASGNGTNASGNGTNASGNGTIASERFERSANDTNASGNGTNASRNGTNASRNGTNASRNGSESTFDVDKIIANVLRSSFKTFTKLITPKDIQQLCRAAKEVLKKKTSLAEIEPPIFLFGDVHGQYSDVLRMFNKIGYPTGDKKYMFIGDFVDRGNQSLEVAVLLMSYMVKYADTFVLLRGNHEVASANTKYGFKTEIESRYGEAEGKDIHRRFNKAFALLPFAGLVGNKILCMHGGISPRINSLQQLRNLNRSIIDRLPDDTAEKDLLWADPNENITGIIFNKARHTSIYFGMDVVDTILKRLDIDRIVRAHQVWDEGIKYFAGGRLISVFSAARYQGKKHNTAVVLNVTADLNITVGFTFEPNYGTPATPNFVIGSTTISATPINAMANATINLTKATTGGATISTTPNAMTSATISLTKATTRSATISTTPINAMASATISPTTGGAPTNGTAYTHALRCWLEKACQSITIESAKLGGRFKVIDCDGALAKLKTANDAIILALGNEFVGRKDGIFLREYVP